MGDDPAKADIAPDLDGQFPLTDLDKKVLSQTDEEFEAHGWEELKRIIGARVHRHDQVHNASDGVSDNLKFACLGANIW